MHMRRYLLLGVLIAPTVAVGTGIWAEFADLDARTLFAVVLPAMVVTLLSVALLLELRPGGVVIAGTARGFVTFAIVGGLYLWIHQARGGFLNYEAYESQRAMAIALFVIHAALGTAVGLGLGCAGAVVAFAVGVRGRKVSPAA